MRGIADYGLVKVANLNFDLTCRVGHRTQVSQVTVATNPYRRSIGQSSGAQLLKPFVKLDGRPTHISVWGLSHFQIADFSENWRSLIRGGIGRIIFHLCASSQSSQPALNFHSSNVIKRPRLHSRQLARAKSEAMVVEDTGDSRDVADGKANEHGAPGFWRNREPCLSDFPARGDTVFGGWARPSPTCGRRWPGGAGSDEGSGEGGGEFELQPSTPVSRALVLAKPQNQGPVPHRTFAQKIPLFFVTLIDKWHYFLIAKWHGRRERRCDMQKRRPSKTVEVLRPGVSHYARRLGPSPLSAQQQNG
jgi:hypothetical protein